MTIDNINQQDTQQTDLQGKQIASMLDSHAKRLNMRSLKQLEIGRARAVKAHAQQVSGALINNYSTNQDGTLSGVYAWAQHHRVASTGLILGSIIIGLVMMEAFGQQQASDAFLLGADLPPEAFVDRGFEPYLNNGKL